MQEAVHSLSRYFGGASTSFGGYLDDMMQRLVYQPADYDTRIQRVRELVFTWNVFFVEADLLPSEDRDGDGYSHMFHKTLPFTIALHKKMMDGRADAEFFFGFLDVFTSTVRNFTKFQEYREETVVFLVNVLGTTFKSCTRAGCSPDMDFAVHKYLLVLDALNGISQPKMSYDLDSAIRNILDYVDLSIYDVLSLLGINLGDFGREDGNGLHALLPATEKIIGHEGKDADGFEDLLHQLNDAF